MLVKKLKFREIQGLSRGHSTTGGQNWKQTRTFHLQSWLFALPPCFFLSRVWVQDCAGAQGCWLKHGVSYLAFCDVCLLVILTSYINLQIQGSFSQWKDSSEPPNPFSEHRSVNSCGNFSSTTSVHKGGMTVPIRLIMSGVLHILFPSSL